MPACQGPQATVPDADVDSAASFLGYLYIVGQYTVSRMTPSSLPASGTFSASATQALYPISATTEFTNCSTPKNVSMPSTTVLVFAENSANSVHQAHYQRDSPEYHRVLDSFR